MRTTSRKHAHARRIDASSAAAKPSAPEVPLSTLPPDDSFLDATTRDSLMANALRANQHSGDRPPPQMSAPAQVRAFADARRSEPADGVRVYTLSSSNDDPGIVVERTELAPGALTASCRLERDERTLVEGRGTLFLNGVAQPVQPGDMVLLPRGSRFQFSADRGVPLRLWTVASGPAPGAVDAPMKAGPGVLAEDPQKEFFVGEGVLVLERANSPADPAVGFDRCRVPQGITTALHQLKTDERYVITRGGGVMELDGKQVEVREGDVVMIPKGTQQRIRAGLGGVDFYTVNTPRFVVEDYDRHVADASVDGAVYDGTAGPLNDVLAKIHSKP